jgi:DNA-directed RNA polymerase subunit omega
MARITSQKAVEVIGSRFDLVLVASQRARELKNGSAPLVDRNDNTPNIVALREIEENKINKDEYLKKYIRKNR